MATHLLELVASVPSGRSFSHGPRREAAAPYASSAVRQMWGTPWERGDAQAREGSVLVADALLLPASRLEPCSPTTARGELHGQNSPLNLSWFVGDQRALSHITENRKVEAPTA